MLQYLARYVFRIAITNCRIVDFDQETVTFRDKDRSTGKHRLCTVSGHEFMRRYLQHVLPQGCHKVRYVGLWHPSRRDQRQRVRHALLLQRRFAPATLEVTPAPEATAGAAACHEPRPCPHCEHGRLVIVLGRLSPYSAMAP